MTHAVALTGQWEGLRAIPRTLRTPDHRKRLEDGLERLGGLFEQMAFRAALLTAGMDRLNGLRASMIDQLDALDAPAEDLEPVGDDEPSLCGVRCGIFSFDTEDGEPSGDEGEPLNVDLTITPSDQSGHRWIGGVCPLGLEGEHDGREPDVDAEPDSDSEASLCGVTFGAPFCPFDYEATMEYGDDQSAAARCVDGPGRSRMVASRPRGNVAVAVGQTVPVFAGGAWSFEVIR